MGDLVEDFDALGVKLAVTVERMDVDGLPKGVRPPSGSDAAALARLRRVMGVEVEGRADHLRADYLLLGDALSLASGSGAAAVAAERQMIRKVLAVLVQPEGVARVDELESRRAARAAAAGGSRRRRKSG